MKATLIVLVSGLLLGGCSKKPLAMTNPAATAIDLVNNRTSTAWRGGYELTVQQQDGNSLGIIEIVQRKPNGEATAIQALKGSVAPESEKSVRITLFDATIVTRTLISKTNEMVVILQRES